jgi:hypothetical protein
MAEEDIAKLLEKLEALAMPLAKLPPEVRLAAFELLKPHLVAEFANARKSGDSTANRAASASSDDMETFFGKFTHDKPADNVKLISAFLYSMYGTEPFTLDEVRDLATKAGLTIPGRPDMTIKAAIDDGKKLYRSLSRDKYSPTVHGEAFLKKTYSIRKGSGQRQQVDKK